MLEGEKLGYLSIDRLEDRATVCAILYRNGYTVSPVRRKVKKTNEYLLKFEKNPIDLDEGDLPNDS